MSMKDGGPAFPQGASFGPDIRRGMSLRDWFAGRALNAIVVLDRVPGDPKVDDYYATVAQYAYAVADAMIAERSK